MGRIGAFALLFCIAPAIAAGAAITDGLIVYYDFEEIFDAQDPPIVFDRSPNEYDGSIGGSSVLSISPASVVKEFGNCGHFEGPTEAYIDLPKLPHEVIPTDAITIAAWVNHAPMSDHMEIFMPMSLNPSKQLIHTELRTGDMARFLIRTPIDPAMNIVDINNVGSVPADTWVHYAATYDRNDGMAYLYLDGEIVAQYEATREMYNEWDQGARVGWTVDRARPFIGYMDEFAIWGRALSQEEIQKVMDEGVIPPVPPRPRFIRGDTDGNGRFIINDGIQILERIFAGRDAFGSNCDKTGDIDGDEALTIGDAIRLFNYLFADGVPPAVPPPVGECGEDPDGALGCEESSPACP